MNHILYDYTSTVVILGNFSIGDISNYQGKKLGDFFTKLIRNNVHQLILYLIIVMQTYS